MKTLFVLRHGKAEHHSPHGDFGRKLTDRGEADAEKAGNHIAKHLQHKPWIVTSDAARALSTAKIAANAMDFKGEIDIDHAIYEASVDDLFDVVRNIPEAEAVAVIVGHNPGLDGLVYRLAKDKSTAVGLGTANVAHVEIDVDAWHDIDEDTGTIISRFEP